MKPFWRGCAISLRFCLGCCGSFLIWSLWLVLLIALGVQLTFLAARELPVPGFVLREIADRLTSTGLQARFGQVQFDPSGRIRIEDMRLGTTTMEDALVTAGTVFIKLDPWALLIREIDVTEIRATAAAFHVPAMLSPAGRSEAVVDDLHMVIRFSEDRRTLLLDEANGRFASLELTAHGALTLPPVRPGSLPLIGEIIQHHLQTSTRAAELIPWLEMLDRPRLALQLTPSAPHLAQVRAELVADQAEVPQGNFGLTETLTIEQPRLAADFLLAKGDALPPLEFKGRQMMLGDRLRVGPLHARVHARFGDQPRSLMVDRVDMMASAVDYEGVSMSPLLAVIRPDALPRLAADVSFGLEGQGWSVSGDLDLRSRAGDLHVSGTVAPALVPQLSRLAERDLSALLTLDTPPRVEATLRLAAGGKLEHAKGSFEAGPLVARSVPLAAARGSVDWSDGRLTVTDFELRTGSSVARGSYEMVPATRDFRFLLRGVLQPMAISGWFREWWPRFWKDFEFPENPPEADVEVTGRWGSPLLTRVFVQADARRAVLRAVPLETLSTRLFIRPGFFDGLAFQAAHDSRMARGSFRRKMQLGTRALEFMEFSVDSDLPAEVAGQLAGPQIAALAAPFSFELPPRIRAEGRIDGPAAQAGEQLEVAFEVVSEAPATFHGFPLDSLNFAGTAERDLVKVNRLTAGFAGGGIGGSGQLSGSGKEQRLAIEGVMMGVQLGDTIRIVEQYGQARRQESHPDAAIRPRVRTGKLDLTLNAEGPPDDFHAFRGTGHAEISEAQLGEINLLGVLSALLRRTLLNYSTLQLDAARAQFELEGNKLAFSSIKLTGPRAAIDASGDYYLDTRSLDFATKIYPFDESHSLLSNALSAVLAPVSAVLEVKLGGRLDKPNWVFVYGPTNLLRSIIGSDPSAPASPAPPMVEPVPLPPAPSS